MRTRICLLVAFLLLGMTGCKSIISSLLDSSERKPKYGDDFVVPAGENPAYYESARRAEQEQIAQERMLDRN